MREVGNDRAEFADGFGATAGADDDEALAMAVVAVGGVADDAQQQRDELASLRRAAATFLASPSTPQKLLVARTTLEPQAKLMRNLLKMSAPSWERKQLLDQARLGSRLYRALEAHRCTLTAPFLQEVCDLLTKDWGDVPEATVGSACEAFRMLGKAGATCFKLMVQRHVQCPYKTFALLFDETGSLAEELLDLPTCMQDPWTRRLLKDKTVDDLKTPSFRAHLEVLLCMVHVDTVSTERAHACNLRKAKFQHQSWAMSLEDLAAYRTIQSATGEFYIRPPVPTKAQRREIAKKSGSKVQRRISPWQAFVSQQTKCPLARGRQRWSRSELRALAEQYRRLGPDDQRRLADLANAMSLERALGAKRPRARQDRRDRQERAQALRPVGGVEMALAPIAEEPCRPLRATRSRGEGGAATGPSPHSSLWYSWCSKRYGQPRFDWIDWDRPCSTSVLSNALLRKPPLASGTGSPMHPAVVCYLFICFGGGGGGGGGYSQKAIATSRRT